MAAASSVGAARDVTSSVVSEVAASSYLSRHPPSHAFDGLSTTAWNEGAPGQGVGEWIEARFSRPVRVAYLTVTPGWDRISPRSGRDLFTANRYLTRFGVEYDGGERSFTVPEGVRLFRADLGAVTTSRVRIVAYAVQHGPVVYEDLCVSEVRVFEGASAGLDRTEVTVEEFAACVAAGACRPLGTAPGCNAAMQGYGRHPANCLDWEQAAAYCRWRGGRLPTAVEWEQAAGTGSGRSFPWGNEPPDCSRGDFTPTGVPADSCGGRGTSPVGSFPAGATPEGILDMAGNVWEWTLDAGDDGASRVAKGGTWGSPAAELQVATSRSVDSGAARPGIGFRCAR